MVLGRCVCTVGINSNYIIESSVSLFLLDRVALHVWVSSHVEFIVRFYFALIFKSIIVRTYGIQRDALKV